MMMVKGAFTLVDFSYESLRISHIRKSKRIVTDLGDVLPKPPVAHKIVFEDRYLRPKNSRATVDKTGPWPLSRAVYE